MFLLMSLVSAVASEPAINIDVAMIVAAAFTGVGGLIGAWYARRKTEAEAKKIAAEAEVIDANAEDIAVKSAGAMIERLMAEVKKLSDRVDMLEREIDVERKRTEEVRVKYAGALERIVELERKLSQAETKLAWQAVEIKQLTEAKERMEDGRK